jgi:hypothetical protein
MASIPTQKTHFLELEQLWLRERSAEDRAGDEATDGGAEREANQVYAQKDRADQALGRAGNEQGRDRA